MLFGANARVRWDEGRLILVRPFRRMVEYSVILRKPICDFLSVLDWVLNGPPYISGHPYETTEGFDEIKGIGTLRCRRCGTISEAH